jgi:hypothetical protein
MDGRRGGRGPLPESLRQHDWRPPRFTQRAVTRQMRTIRSSATEASMRSSTAGRHATQLTSDVCAWSCDAQVCTAHRPSRTARSRCSPAGQFLRACRHSVEDGTRLKRWATFGLGALAYQAVHADRVVRSSRDKQPASARSGRHEEPPKTARAGKMGRTHPCACDQSTEKTVRACASGLAVSGSHFRSPT